MLASVGAVVGSCCGCMTLVEFLAREEPTSMDLMTFSTFLFIALEGLVVGTRGLSRPRRIPLLHYLKLVVVFFVVSVVNNKALAFRVPVPLHIIFRSGSLLASLVLGKVLLRRSYPWRKYVGVGLVSGGICLCTLASSRDPEGGLGEAAEEAGPAGLIAGVGLMAVALVLSAYLGVCQEALYARYGKHTREVLFYVHALSLPGFLLLKDSIATGAQRFSSSPPLSESVPVPRLWAALAVLDVAQYVCIRSVYALTAEHSALTVTLVITVRKLLSLFVSILYFGSPFTALHCVGALGVFAGTALFSDLHAVLKGNKDKRDKEE